MSVKVRLAGLLRDGGGSLNPALEFADERIVNELKLMP
ncbi:MAG: hypothetical protein QOH99_721, partial [Frankiaceae bacterium]|nr:hypothetical protein [Frankiaceae bacterium]